MAYVGLLKEEVQAELQAKVSLLDKAKEAGLISESEQRTKMAALYQSYFRSDRSKIEEIIINKIEG
jgi:predicted nucleic acid-binding protein